VGADGGHGPVRYQVTAYDPGERVEFAFRPPTPLQGVHEFRVDAAGPQRCVLSHVLVGRARGVGVLLWPLAVRWLHDACIEELLDNAELAATGRLARPARRSAWVRLIRARLAPKPQAVPVPADAGLVRGALSTVDFQDAWSVPLPAGVTRDPAAWARAIFRDPPGWVTSLLRLRNAIVGVVGIERGDSSAFDPIARTENEVLLGTDAGHLDFRASVLVGAHSVTLSTVVALHNARGRAYMAIVKRVHPAIVRAMLARAARKLADNAPPAPLRSLAEATDAR
jgi:hypothetical protein